MNQLIGRRRRAAIISGLLLLAAGWAMASPIVMGTQVRSVSTSASASPGSGSDSDFAVPTGSGSWQVGSAASGPAAGPAGAASASASQTSNFGASVLELSSQARLTATLPAGSTQLLSANAESRARLEFDVVADSSFVLTGFLDTLAVVTGGANLPTFNNLFRFMTADASTVIFEALTDDETLSVNGFLAAGHYRMDLWADVGGLLSGVSPSANFRSIDGTSSLSMRLELTPVALPEPASLPLAGLALGLLVARGTRRSAASLERRLASPQGPVRRA